LLAESKIANSKEERMSIVADRSEKVIPTGTWSIDPAHSVVEFGIRYVGLVPVEGRAPVVRGTIVGGDRPSIEGTVDVSSLTSFDEQRDAHLKSPDFFDAERYPELSFSSTSVSYEGDRVVVEGDLTMKGVTKPVTLSGTFAGSASDPWGNERVGLELETRVDRTQWGIEWNAPLPGGGFLLPDEVDLRASFSAIKSA
jgi:polyisoprenoid-binding protein YceI